MRERIRRKVHRSRDRAREDLFDYIEVFYQPTRKHRGTGCYRPPNSKDSRKTHWC